MGLSASQARLLSITQRLSDNELHSEIIANSKMRLADESIIAKNNYVNALDATKLQYVGFDGYGNTDTVDLTFNSLMLYSEIKNQNILKNSNGQVLISATDAYNFETSNNMYEFLEKYGLCDLTGYAPSSGSIAAWQDAYAEFAEQHYNWEHVLMPQYYADLEFYESNNTPDAIYNQFVSVVGTTSNPLYCYYHALNPDENDVGCFIHLLSYLLCGITQDFNENLGYYDSNYNFITQGNSSQAEHLYTSLPGVTTQVLYDDYAGSKLTALFYTGEIDEEPLGYNALYNVYHALLDETNNLCDGDDDLTTPGSQNYIWAAIEDEHRPPYDYEILMSDYIYNSEIDTDHPYGSVGGLKSLRQKTIDMMELIKNASTYFGYNGNNIPSDVLTSLRNLLISYVDGDLHGVHAAEPERPVEPTFNLPYPGTEYPLIDFEDKPLVQWYINLWHAIDGQSDPSELRALYDENGIFTSYTVENKERQTQYLDGVPLNPAFQVIPDELRNDANWLQHALANNIISINQVIMDSNANKLVWSGIEYTSTTSFNEVADNKKVAKAEAEYQAEMKRIENEDSKYDMKLKKLDTEHSALKTEYESVAGLIGKNIERSYKIFDA